MPCTFHSNDTFDTEPGREATHRGRCQRWGGRNDGQGRRPL